MGPSVSEQNHLRFVGCGDCHLSRGQFSSKPFKKCTDKNSKVKGSKHVAGVRAADLTCSPSF